MNRRPYLTHKQRPLSAIFIGSLDSNSAPSIPDLPVLPSSPSTSSNGSGLPSPPATNSTNSTGSGEGSANGGSLRRKTARSEAGSDMRNGSFTKSQASSKSRASNFSDDEDDHHDHENDEDTTARFTPDRRRSSQTSETQENVSALLRVKSLTQRNRMVLDKLSSMSRSPAPSKSSRSPFSPPANEDLSSTNSSNTSSSRLQTASRPRTSLSNVSNTQIYSGNSSLGRIVHDYSGSETEREPEAPREYGHNYSSSDSMSATPTTSYSEARSIVSETTSQSRFIRRRLSAPAPPEKVLNSSTSTVTRDSTTESIRSRERSRERSRAGDRSRAASRAASRGPSPGPSRTPRKRISTLSVRDSRYDDDGEEADRDDITSAALAAVASSRRSPTGSRRSRGTPPKEFKETEGRSMDLREPTTPPRNRDRERAQRRSPSPRSPRASNSSHTSPRKYARSSTIREITRRHQTRWLSEDLSAQDRDEITSNIGRRQTKKTGSSESPLAPPTSFRRSVVGEGLRAAGLTRQKEPDEDPFGRNGDSAVTPKRTRSNGSGTIANGENRYSSPAPAGISYSRASERAPDPRTPAQRHERTATYTGGIRPGTSMAALHSDEPRTAPPALRTYRSSYAMEREPSSSSSQQPSEVSSGYDNTNRGNHTAPLPASAIGGASTRDPHAERRRLMLDSLSMFESQLSRLPPMGQTTTTTIPDVFQTSQHLVHSMDKLNTMLKTGSNQALEAQIEAEVSDLQDQVPSEIWAKVGMDYRETLRTSDEVVRTMTTFLLGISRVLRDANNNAGTHQHLRTMSLDEDVVGKRSADGMSAGSLSVDRRSSDGRRSRETRRSWDPRENSITPNYSRRSSRERSSGALSRPGSSMNHVRSSAASSGTKSSEGSPRDATHSTIRNLPSALLNSANRPFSTPREQRVISDPSRHPPSAFDSPDGYEPSPTPASRNSSALGRSRALPPLAIPPSLSTLPSETLLRQSATSSTDKSRRKISSNSNLTVKAESSTSLSFQPTIKPSNPTTAVTPHTVSHSPEVSMSSLPGNSNSSFTHTNGVVFSKPSMSALNGLQRRQRSISSASGDDHEPLPAVSKFTASLRSPMSGSETERPRTLGIRSRTSLDRTATPERSNTIGSSASTLLSSRRERRRTITEVFPA